jgi:FKBP-type peptidyl-prolyl cis-trans isomerase FklB
MKKISFYAIMAIIAAGTASCGNNYKADIRDEVDTLSYAIALANGGQIKPYIAQQGVDTAYMADFIKGFNEGAKISGDKKQAAYYAGLDMGMKMSSGINNQIFGDDENYKLSRKNLVAGLVAGIKGDTTVMNVEKVMPRIDAMAKEIHDKVMAKKYSSNKEEGAKFLAENGKKEGVKTLPSGLQYKVLKEGEGPIPSDTARVKVNYEGKTIDGNVFDSSFERKQPVEMMIRQNIPGFAEALTHMPVGSTWEIYIPAELAYGEREMGQIKPYSTLIFKVELLEILK